MQQKYFTLAAPRRPNLQIQLGVIPVLILEKNTLALQICCRFEVVKIDIWKVAFPKRAVR